MSENNLISSCSSALNMQSENRSDENQDIGVVLHKMSLNEIQSQSNCVATVKQNGEQMTPSMVAQSSIQTSNSPAIVQEEESELIQNNMSEQNSADEAVSSQQVKEESSMADVPQMVHISEKTNLFEMPSGRSGNVVMVVVNVSCSRNIPVARPVARTVMSNLPTSVNLFFEKNDSEVLTESAGTNNSFALETSNEENRWRFYRQRVLNEDPIIISSDDDSDIATNVSEHSPLHTIADISLENEATDQRQTYPFDVAKYSFKSFADVIAEFHEKEENTVADILHPTTDIPMENELTDQQQINASDVPKDSYNSIADIPEENAVITVENQTNVATDIPKDSLNSVADTPVENEFNADLLNPTTDIPFKNELNDQQQANSSDVPKDVLNPIADMSMTNVVNDQQRTNSSNVPKVDNQQQTNSSDVPTDSLNSIADIPEENAVMTDENQANFATDIPKDSMNSIADIPVENAVTDQSHTNCTDGPEDSIAVIPVKNAVITEQTNLISSNGKTERYNRDECQLKVILAGEQNQIESWAVTIPDELEYVSIDSIDTSVESEEWESPSKGRIDVTECNDCDDDDTEEVTFVVSEDDGGSEFLNSPSKEFYNASAINITECNDDDTEEETFVVSEDDGGPEFVYSPSDEFYNAEHNSKDAVSDEFILLSDTEEPIRSNEEDDPSRSTDERSFVTASRFFNQILIDRIKSGKLDLMKLYPILNLVKAINEAFKKEEPVLTDELLDIEKRFIDASIQTIECDVHATSDPDEILNFSVVDLASEVEVQVQEALLNVDCEELKVQKLEEKTDGQSSKLTERRAEESHDKILTAVQFPLSSKKANKKKAKNDDVDMTSKDRKHFKPNDENLTNEFDFKSKADRKIIKGKKRFLADSYETSTPMAPAEKKSKYSLRRGFFGRSLSNIATKWRDQGKKIKSKLGFKGSPSPPSQWTSAGNFSVTAFPKEEDCENVSGFLVIPTHYSGGDI